MFRFFLKLYSSEGQIDPDPELDRIRFYLRPGSYPNPDPVKKKYQILTAALIYSTENSNVKF